MTPRPVPAIAVANQRLAFRWHLADVAVHAALFAFAVGGLAGHIWLRRRITWHESHEVAA